MELSINHFGGTCELVSRNRAAYELDTGWKPWLAGQVVDHRHPSALQPGAYALLTVHRAGNTDDRVRLRRTMQAAGDLEMPVLCPAHPRTAKALRTIDLELPSNAPYLAMLSLQCDATVILTDSGGVQ